MYKELKNFLEKDLNEKFSDLSKRKTELVKQLTCSTNIVTRSKTEFNNPQTSTIGSDDKNGQIAYVLPEYVIGAIHDDLKGEKSPELHMNKKIEKNINIYLKIIINREIEVIQLRFQIKIFLIMKRGIFMKKILLLLVVFVFCLAGAVAQAADLPGNMRAILNLSDNPIDYRILQTISFTSGEEMPSDVYDSWEVVPGKIKAWINVERRSTSLTPPENWYNIIINSDETIFAPENCEQFFSGFNVTNITLNNFDTSKTTNMMGMFALCQKLDAVNIRGFNTSNVTNMGYMFMDCRELGSMDLRELDTSNVTDMTAMFSGCNNIWNVNFSSDVSKVTKIEGMFANCYALDSDIDMSNFDFGKMENLRHLFLYCFNLKSIYISMPSEDVTDAVSMFDGCHALDEIIIKDHFSQDEIHKFWGDDTNLDNFSPVLSLQSEEEKNLLKQNDVYVQTFGEENIKVHWEPTPTKVFGDMDNDGKITIIDVRLLLQLYINQ